ncbi:MAG TPA: hypothetical protein ENN19_13475 [Chloroflexi bacterium]|nr:hypothetical protein [Chloroflexota bacterium]
MVLHLHVCVLASVYHIIYTLSTMYTINQVATMALVLALTLTLAVASPAFAQEGEPGDVGPDVPLHIEDMLCPLSPRGLEGCITQGFHAHHRGIDVSLWGGTPISATHAGTVACGGWIGGHFGNLVIIRSEGDGSTELAEVPPEWES